MSLADPTLIIFVFVLLCVLGAALIFSYRQLLEIAKGQNMGPVMQFLTVCIPIFFPLVVIYMIMHPNVYAAIFRALLDLGLISVLDHYVRRMDPPLLYGLSLVCLSFAIIRTLLLFFGIGIWI